MWTIGVVEQIEMRRKKSEEGEEERGARGKSWHGRVKTDPYSVGRGPHFYLTSLLKLLD